ncbi:hypothetical protein BJ878DRAFT_128019 [Calycina marina]|uniref:Uncharacterized protein n=1 Tax=Calycina marina TaxID=1763456 RepID=A0A9P7Z186_9HELO|nr:hypothetical protein BJ878DRAFT_128019 [Calycina marina]
MSTTPSLEPISHSYIMRGSVVGQESQLGRRQGGQGGVENDNGGGEQNTDNSDNGDGITTSQQIISTTTPTSVQSATQSTSQTVSTTSSTVIPTSTATASLSSSSGTSKDVIIASAAGGAGLLLLSVSLLLFVLRRRKVKRAQHASGRKQHSEKHEIGLPTRIINESEVPLQGSSSSPPGFPEWREIDGFFSRSSSADGQSRRAEEEANFAAAYPALRSGEDFEEAEITSSLRADPSHRRESTILSVGLPDTWDARDAINDEASPNSTVKPDAYPKTTRTGPQMRRYTDSSVSARSSIQNHSYSGAVLIPETSTTGDHVLSPEPINLNSTLQFPMSAEVANPTPAFPFSITPQTTGYTDASFASFLSHSTSQARPVNRIRSSSTIRTTSLHRSIRSLDTMGFPETPMCEDLSSSDGTVPAPLQFSPQPKSSHRVMVNRTSTTSLSPTFAPVPYMAALKSGSLEKLVRQGMGRRGSDGSLISNSTLLHSESPMLDIRERR